MMRFTLCRVVPLRLARLAAAALVVGMVLGSTTLNAGAQPSDSSAADSSAVAPASPPGSPAVVREAEYVERLRVNFTPRNRAYSQTRVALALFDPFYDVLVAAILLFTGLAAGMRDVVERRFRNGWARSALYTAMLLAALYVLNFPLSLYRGFILQHQYELSNQTFVEWLVDGLKALGANWVAFGLAGLIGLMLWGIARSPKYWWAWLGAASLPVLLITTLLTPLVFDPLFNKFEPLRDPALAQRIVALAERAQIPGRRVYQVDRSKQTRAYNAYVSGFGASQRIVLWDTILDGMQDDEILFVMGHEMGHYRLNHIWKGVLMYSALCFLLFWVSGVAMSAAIKRWGSRWRVRGLSDLAALPLLLVTFSLASFLAGPAINGISRIQEHESDGFGLEVTHSNDAAARAFIALASQNRSNPEPAAWIKWMLYSHPPVIERVRFAATYRPWETGEPNRYFKPRHGAAP